MLRLSPSRSLTRSLALSTELKNRQQFKTKEEEDKAEQEQRSSNFEQKCQQQQEQQSLHDSQTLSTLARSLSQLGTLWRSLYAFALSHGAKLVLGAGDGVRACES